MNRNTESHFANNPTIDISRSKFDRSFTHKTTFNTGDIIPIYCDTTIMPGDTVKMRMSEVVRMATPIAPVMDNCNMDTYFFFVPYRLIWDHFKAFMGENDTAPWIQNVEYEIPQITAPASGWHKGSLADYFGYPTEVGGYSASALPFRAYSLIYNEWFRDENLKNPLYISKGDTTIAGTDKTDLGAAYDPVIDTQKGAAPVKAAKYFDYFTSCLPGAQKGPSVEIPLGKTAPVLTMDYGGNTSGLDGKKAKVWNDGGNLQLYGVDYNDPNIEVQLAASKGVMLETDLSKAVGATINQLRQAFAIQKFYERQALGGTRYIEMVKSHFEVTNPDFRMQRPEYLGGERVPITMNQVIQSNAQTWYEKGLDEDDKPIFEETVPMGSTGAFSVTSNVNEDLFTHSFTEHGILIGLAVVRTVHTYQQGLNRMYSKKKFTDFYFPEFANLGNQAVLNKEIYCQSDTVVDTDGKVINDQAFGYQEAWACERYFPDIVTGEFRSNYAQSLDVWHYADDYSGLPSLGDVWIDEPEENVARTLAVQDQDQFIGDFYFGSIYTRPMPLWSVPGLIDHH